MIVKIIKNIRSALFGTEAEPSASADKAVKEKSSNRANTAGRDKSPADPSERDDSPKKAAGKSRPRKRKRRPDVPKTPVAKESAVQWDLSQFEAPPQEGKIRFHDFDLPDEIMHAIYDLGFQYCTPIQAEIMPILLAGKDAMGQAQTGTGKTAAFLIAVLEELNRNRQPGRSKGSPRVLIIAPTRELAIQIEKEAGVLNKYLGFSTTAVFGGMDYQKQKRDLSDQVIDIVAATPGRLLDFHQHRDVDLSKVEILIIDEADRMLDMGFIPQVNRIVRATPMKDKRRTWLFSATITPDVERLAAKWTTDPSLVSIRPEKIESDSINQIIYLVTTNEKIPLLYNLIVRQDLRRVIVFCNRRDETRRLVEIFKRYRVNCAALSGEVPQKKRVATLERFRSGDIRVLVATDVAGRGIHVDAVSHVINYTLPTDPENYVHRIGRTGRAGAVGVSISFACEEDSFRIPDIEALLGHEMRCIQPEEGWTELPPPPPEQKPRRGRKPPVKRKAGRNQKGGASREE